MYIASTGRRHFLLQTTVAGETGLLVGGGMGWDSKPFIGSKRRRPEVEDEVYLDNFHTHKRYLSEVMASSLNGLRVGEAASNSTRPSPSLSDPLASPARTDTGCLSRSASSFPSLGDDLSTLDSPMSEDSDESVGYRMRGVESMHQGVVEASSLSPSSPPRRTQRAPSSHNLPAGSSSWTPTPAPTPMRSPYAVSHPLPCSRPRSNEAEGRLPPSPSDACQSADLRKATLIRALHRAQSPSRPASPVVRINKVTVPDVQHSVVGVASAAEQTGCNSEVLGSPLRGASLGVAGRSSRVRSLLLDEQPAMFTGATSSEASLSSGNEYRQLEKSHSVSVVDGSDCKMKSGSDPSSLKPEISFSYSSKDGNVSDTESSLSRKSARASCSKTSARKPPTAQVKHAEVDEGLPTNLASIW